MEKDFTHVVPTGFEQLDCFLNGGLPTGKLTFLAGCSAIGVTQFGLSLAANIARNRQYVGFFSQAMAKHLLEKRLQIMEETDVANYILIDNILCTYYPDEWIEHITDMVQKPYEVKCIVVDDFELLEFRRGKSKTSELQKKFSENIISFETYCKEYTAARNYDLAESAFILQSLAKELDIAILVGCHHERFVMSDTTHIPTLKKMWHSTAILPVADRLLYLYRSGFYRSASGYFRLDCDKFQDEGYAQIGYLYPKDPHICVLHYDAKHIKFTD